MQVKALNSARGNGYHTTFRKEVAETIISTFDKETNKLTPQGNKYATQLILEGLSRSCLTKWLLKYTTFRGVIILDFVEA